MPLLYLWSFLNDKGVSCAEISKNLRLPERRANMDAFRVDIEWPDSLQITPNSFAKSGHFQGGKSPSFGLHRSRLERFGLYECGPRRQLRFPYGGLRLHSQVRFYLQISPDLVTKINMLLFPLRLHSQVKFIYKFRQTWSQIVKFFQSRPSGSCRQQTPRRGSVTKFYTNTTRSVVTNQNLIFLGHKFGRYPSRNSYCPKTGEGCEAGSGDRGRRCEYHTDLEAS